MNRHADILNVKTLVLLFLFYVALLVVWGYEFASDDHVQIIPSLLAQKDSSLYKTDFYITHSMNDSFNERSFLLLFLKPFFDESGWGIFILHSLFSMLLLTALFQLSYIFLQDKILCWLALCVLFIPLMYHSLGSVELYNAGLSPAEAIAAWTIVFWLQRKILPAYIILIGASLFHPVVGMHVFLLITGVEILLQLFDKQHNIKVKKLILPVLLFLCTAGVFIFLLRSRLNDAEMADEDFFTLFFSFRNAHHYIPHSFSKVDLILLLPVYICTPLLFFKRNKPVFYFSVLILLGCLVYTIAVEQFHSVLFASTQWFKSTIWLEFFAVVGVLALLKEFLLKKFFNQTLLPITLLVCMGWVFVIFPGYSDFKNIPYQFPFYTKTTDAIDICRQAEQATEKDALFLQPCSFSELKYYGRRSSYVEFKALTHKKSFLKEWGERFEKVYQVPLAGEKKSFEACAEADKHFQELKEADVLNLQVQTHADYLLTYKTSKLNFPVACENHTYIVYRVVPSPAK